MQDSLTIEEKIKRREEVQKQTLDETYDLLKQAHKCVMLRPTGFGKTYLMIKIAKMGVNEGVWDKVIFIYPRDVIRKDTLEGYRDDLKGVDVDFRSYQWLGIRYKQEELQESLDLSGYKKVLFLIDEAHFCGAPLWYEAIRYLELAYPQFYFLGATATPYRLDGVDVVQSCFDGVTPFSYTRHQAVLEGVLEKPVYVSGLFHIAKQLEDKANKILNKQKLLQGDAKKMAVMRDFLNKKILEYSKYENQKEAIRENVEKYIQDRDYMKFLVYFPSIKILEEMKSDVFLWFSEAFPDMVVESLVVVKGDKDALDKMLSLERVEGKIDLIMCIDMISYGYHVEDLTGEVMLRFTKSNIVFNQQSGRCFSIIDTSCKIIFDFVGNANVTSYAEGLITPGKSENPNVFGVVDVVDNFERGDLIEVDARIVDINDICRLFEVDRISLEKAVVEAMENKGMPREVAKSELKVDDAGLDRVLEKYGCVV